MRLGRPIRNVASNIRDFTETISWQDMLGIALGAFIQAVAIVLVLVPAHLLTGGVTGIAIILEYLTGVKVWLWVIALNIPIFIAGYRFVSRRFAFYSLLGTLTLTFFLGILQNVHINLGINNLLLSAILGGVISGAGMGITLRSKGSTGGIDIVAVIISRYWGYEFGTVSFSVNLGILAVMLFISNVELALFTAIGMFVVGRVTDAVQSGPNVGKTALIVTGMADDISREIIENLHRGCTILQGRGAYTGETRDILMVTVSRTQLPRLKEIVFQLDPNAFLSIHESIEVYGRGFMDCSRQF